MSDKSSRFAKISAGSAAVLLIICLGVATVAGDPRPPDVGPFSGKWYAHDELLEIDGDGSGRIVWRLGENCGNDDPGPCDRFDGTGITPGGLAKLEITHVKGLRATGKVTESSAPTYLANGPIKLRLDREKDLLHVSPRPTHPSDPPFPDGRPYCGPRARVGACGA